MRLPRIENMLRDILRAVWYTDCDREAGHMRKETESVVYGLHPEPRKTEKNIIKARCRYWYPVFLLQLKYILLK